jgi:sec-independent protein translocase protein TatA
MLAGLGAPEIAIILVILVLLFGAKKLPDLARGTGRALNIFKAETKGLLTDDDDEKTVEQKQIDAQRSAPPAAPVEEVHEVHEVRKVDPPAEQPRPDADR